MSQHFRERVPAVVTGVSDPEQRGRIKVRAQSISGDSEIPAWIEPCFPYSGAGDAGWFFIPDEGEMVDITFVKSHSGDDTPGMSAVRNPDYRWVGVLHGDKDSIPEEFRSGSSYGTRMGIKTPSGSFFMFDEVLGDIVLKAATLVRLGSVSASKKAAREGDATLADGATDAVFLGPGGWVDRVTLALAGLAAPVGPAPTSLTGKVNAGSSVVRIED